MTFYYTRIQSPNPAYPGEFLHINNQRAHNNYENIILKEPNENPQRAHLGPRAPLWTTLLLMSSCNLPVQIRVNAVRPGCVGTMLCINSFPSTQLLERTISRFPQRRFVGTSTSSRRLIKSLTYSYSYSLYSYEYTVAV